jgi:DNA end-binding protein Ku
MGRRDYFPPSERELAMANQLIDSMTVAWDPEKYEDTHRTDVLALIERKAAGEEIATVPDVEREAAEVVDLVAALEASLAAAKNDDDAGAAVDTA